MAAKPASDKAGTGGRLIAAKVEKVDGLAKPIERRSPVKYFEVTLSFEELVPELVGAAEGNQS